MRNGFKVIDADAHMQEPPYIWDHYVEAEFYDRRPRATPKTCPPPFISNAPTSYTCTNPSPTKIKSNILWDNPTRLFGPRILT